MWGFLGKMIFITSIEAIDPETNELKVWAGPSIVAKSWDSAEKYRVENGLGYCKIVGMAIAEIEINGTVHRVDDPKLN